MLGKAVLDGQPLAAHFHPLLFRALLSDGRRGLESATLHDLDAFSPATARSCRQLLAADDVSSLGLAFDNDDDNGGGGDVTSANVKVFVRERAAAALLRGRAPRLHALRRGFQALPLLPHLRLFSVFELMALVCGSPALDAPTLLARLEFKGFGRASATPRHLKEVLRSFSDPQRLQFVAFVTASAALPPRVSAAAASLESAAAAAASSAEDTSDLSRGMLVVQRVAWPLSRLPLAHTCFDRLDLPEYGDEATLRAKLTWCLDNLEMAGFGEA